MNTVFMVVGYEKEQVRQAVEPVRKSKTLPQRTLDHWMLRLGIYRDEYGYFSESDIELLKDLARWLYHPRHTIDQFIQIKRQAHKEN